VRRGSLALIGLVGCALITELDGLDDGTLPTADGGVDGRVAEVPPDTDARTATDGGAADSDGCAGFCDDFDDGALGARWSRVAVSGGSIETDTTTFRSAPRALRSRVNAGVREVPRLAVLELSIDPLAASVRCAFSVRLRRDVDATETGWLDVFRIVGEAPQVSRYELNFGTRQRRQSGVRLDIVYADGGIEGPRTNREILQPLRVDTWTDVVLETDFRSVSLTFDGGSVLSGPFDFGFRPTTARVALGARNYASQEADVVFDDLRCSFTY